jgi:hypothetical protein
MGGLEEFHDSRSEQHMGILGSVAALRRRHTTRCLTRGARQGPEITARGHRIKPTYR